MLRYVCISDLHAGAVNSLIMPHDGSDPEDIQPVTDSFARAFGAFLQAARATPQMILLGDLLDMQFSDRETAGRNGAAFLKHLRQHAPLADDVIATAGNHDHGLWTDARLSLEAQMLNPPAGAIVHPDSNRAFTPNTGNSRVLDAVLHRAGFGNVDLRYPNIGFRNADRAVLLHHGHFAEAEYRLISTLHDQLSGTSRNFPTAAEIAAENAGWIDFFWSSISDTGFSTDASDLYQNLLTTTGYRRLADKMSHKLAAHLSEALPFARNTTAKEVLQHVTHAGIDMALGKFRDTERFFETIALSPKGYEGLLWYLNGPAHAQILAELSDVPNDLTFVFGHTHKPFTDRIAAESFAHPIKTYNTGGWTLNGPRVDSAEGAAMVLIDDDLNVATVRIFSTPTNGGASSAYVEMLGMQTPSGQAFYDALQTWLAQSQPEWDALRDAATAAYVAKQAYLLDLTAAQEAAE